MSFGQYVFVYIYRSTIIFTSYCGQLKMTSIVFLALAFMFTCDLSSANKKNACPQILCPLDHKIPKDCRKAEYVIGEDFKTRCRVCDSNLCGDMSTVCPVIYCPNDRKIKKDCRRPNFEIGTDGITKCRLCDSSVCGKKREVCPQIQCPNDLSIPKYCRAKTFEIGTDGITRCRVCDRDRCLKN